MLDSRADGGRRRAGRAARRPAIPTPSSRSPKTTAAAKPKRPPTRLEAKRRIARKLDQRARATRHPEEPLGVGVGDVYAVKRLKVPSTQSRARPNEQVEEIGWAAFGEMAREMAGRIARRYEPDIVVGLAKGGVFVGGALAGSLGVDFYPLRLEKRSRDAQKRSEASDEMPDLRGRRALIVDDVMNSGRTLARARRLARKAGAAEVQAAVLVVRPGGVHPEWWAMKTKQLVVYPWDLQLEHGEGAAESADPAETGV